MKKVILHLCLLAAITCSFSACFLLSGTSSSSSSSSSTPTVDYAPQLMKKSAYIQFNRPNGETIKIVFESNNQASSWESSATNGRINAAYYKYDGFNMATLKYNHQANGDVSRQYTAELNFTSATGGKIKFTDTDTTASFTYRP